MQRVRGAAVNLSYGAVIVHAEHVVGGRAKIGAGEIDVAHRICANAAEGGGAEALGRDAGLRGHGDDGLLFAVRGDANQVEHAHEQHAAFAIDGEFAGAERGWEAGRREFAIGRNVVGIAEAIEHVEAALGIHDDDGWRREVLCGVGSDGQRGAALAGAGGGGEQAVSADFADEAGSEFGDEEIAGAIEGDAGGIEQPGIACGSAIGRRFRCGAGQVDQGGLRGDFADHSMLVAMVDRSVSVKATLPCVSAARLVGEMAVWSGGPSGDGEVIGPPARVVTMPLVSIRRIRAPVEERTGRSVWTK